MSVRERRQLRFAEGQAKPTGHVVNQTIILHSPQFSINNTYLEHVSPQVPQVGKKNSCDQSTNNNNYYQINQVSTIDNRTIESRNENNQKFREYSIDNITITRPSDSISNQNYDISKTHDAISKASLTFKPIQSSSTLPIAYQQSNQSLKSKSVKQNSFIPPPPSSSAFNCASRLKGRPNFRTNSVKRASEMALYAQQSQQGQPFLRQSDQQHQNSLSGWIHLEENKGIIDLKKSLERRSRERLEKSNQLSSIYGVKSNNKRQGLLISDKRSSSTGRSASIVKQRSNKGNKIDQNQTISYQKSINAALEKNFRSLSNNDRQHLNPKTRSDSLPFQIQPSYSSGNQILSFAAPLSAMETGDPPRNSIRPRPRPRSLAQKRVDKIEDYQNQEDLQNEEVFKFSLLKEMAEKNQRNSPFIENDLKFASQHSKMQSYSTSLDKQTLDYYHDFDSLQFQKQIKTSQPKINFIPSRKDSSLQEIAQLSNCVPVGLPQDPYQFIKNDSKENINQQFNQRNIVDLYAQEMVKNENLSTQNYDRNSSQAQITQPYQPLPTEDSKLFQFEKNQDPNRSFSDLPETENEPEQLGGGFIIIPSNPLIFNSPKNIMKPQYFFGGSTHNPNQNCPLSSLNSFGLKKSIESFYDFPQPAPSRNIGWIDVEQKSFAAEFSSQLPPPPPKNNETEKIQMKKASKEGNQVRFCDSPIIIIDDAKQSHLQVKEEMEFRRNVTKNKKRNELLNKNTLRDSKNQLDKLELEEMKQRAQQETTNKQTLIPIPKSGAVKRPKPGFISVTPLEEEFSRNSFQKNEQEIQKHIHKYSGLPENAESASEIPPSERNPVEEGSTIHKEDYERNLKELGSAQNVASFNMQVDQLISNSYQKYLNLSYDD